MAEGSKLVIPVEDAAYEPYASILAYPAPDLATLTSRIQQLRELGVSGLEFTGRLKIGKASLLGKGVAGIVVIGRTGKEKVALKIRRTDSRRDSVRNEASMLKVANSVNVGPAFYGNTSDVISMQLIEGHSLPEWLPTLTGRDRRLRFRSVAGNLFDQCLRLDNAGLDHGELSRAHKNVCVTETERPVILDFESASRKRSPSNLTCIAQYLFLGGGFAKRVRRITGPVDSAELKRILRSHKHDKSPDAFHRLQDLLKLQC